MVFNAFCLVLPQLPEGTGWNISAEFWKFPGVFPWSSFPGAVHNIPKISSVPGYVPARDQLLVHIPFENVH